MKGRVIKDEGARKPGLSRRDFLRLCTAGVGGAAAFSVLGNRAFAAARKFPVSTGPAARTFNLDRNWLFGGKFDGSGLGMTFDDNAYERVVVPHCVSKLSWQEWDPSDWEKVWIYRRHFDMPPELMRGRVFIQFEGVMVGTTPVINGHTLPQHLGGYLPSRFEITDWVRTSGNILAVIVDSRWSNVPPEGAPVGPKRIDYLEPGGIFRSVQLQVVPDTFISDVFAKPVKVLDAGRRIDVKCTIDSGGEATGSGELTVELLDGDRVVSRASRSVRIDKPGTTEADLVLSGLGNVRLWDVDSPNLYHVSATLSINGRPVHDYTVRTGLRDARFELDGFYLNGKRLQIFGLDRHELFPYVGFAMPGNVMRRDAEILRRDFNCNMVRCSHYPQSEAFMNACDELGLLAWEEVPGWGYLGDDAWKDLLVRDVRNMVIRDRNHPAVIIWGVRVNESHNDPQLYKHTRELAKSLDDSRPTSGTMTPGSRKTWKTEWHQDVFAFDDYHADPDGGVGIRKPVEGYPYLITEAVGQYNYAHPKEGFNVTYRRTGDVEVQASQAIWHAQAHSRAAEDKRISGLIAWCGYDYGSLINAYHHVKCPGVADIFRIPKLGASFYLAQKSVEKGAVIEPDFYWSFGPKTPHGPGTNAAIFSNCDRLELSVDGHHHSTLHPDAKNYPNLMHAPFFADLRIGGTGNPELRIDGYVGKRLVKSRSFSSDTSHDRFVLMSDENKIHGDGGDAVRVVFMVTDNFGTPRLSGEGKVKFDMTGPGFIVGDNPFDLGETGGVGAIWLRALPGSEGKVKLSASHPALGSQSVTISVIGVGSDPTGI